MSWPEETLKIIKSRRSVRSFRPEKIPPDTIKKVLEAGRWAPSGLNNQPWRFIVVTSEEMKSKIKAFTTDAHIIEQAPCLIVVLLNQKSSYDRTKDLMAIGACIQNMLLLAHSLDLGTCWLGEILNRREEVEKILGVSPENEMVAVVALGYPLPEERKSSRHNLEKLILKEF
jgi:nitroreductase